MTTEEDFQRALDATPDDWQTRLVFADWLEERGDPRAEGYRALGRLRRKTRLGSYVLAGHHWWTMHGDETDLKKIVSKGSSSCLPRDWERLCAKSYPSRREAEDGAAKGFARLPDSRRAKLLADIERLSTIEDVA